MTDYPAVTRRAHAAQDRVARRVLGGACGTHALHDGFADLLYVLLPLWQAEFGLGYAQIGLLRAAYTGVMAGFQVPSSYLAGRVGRPALLALGTALAGAGFLLMGTSHGLALLVCGLLLSGFGSSTQHPIGSDLVAHAFAGRRSRGALGTYNFAGDLGKMIFPAMTTFALASMSWRSTALLLGALGLSAAVLIALVLRDESEKLGAAKTHATEDASAERPAVRERRGGFPILLSIGMIDSATRMGFLTFLPFLLTGKGADLATLGAALTLVFAGGAVGKLVCGFLGARLGVLGTVFLTEGGTALGIVALLPLPLGFDLMLLPLIGVALNGTSSVLYGSVPELVAPERRARAFGLFYTGTIGTGAIAPAIFGLFSDALGVPAVMNLIAGVVLLTLPLTWLLSSRLRP
jgi:MFS family permease